jgi:PTH1 family peptidyl-tRNA hydrolase
MNKYLIVGLGNIGQEYAHTRHNIGFDVVAAFVLKHGGSFCPGRLAETATIKVKGRTFVCICPTTYMNVSGKAVKYWLDKENIPVAQSLTILDDLSLPLDKLRLRASGSAGGHNGLRSIEESLGTQNYPRLRFGIGNNYPKGMQAEFVLGKWLASELPVVQLKVEKSVTVIEDFAFAGIENTMTAANKLIVKVT